MIFRIHLHIDDVNIYIKFKNSPEGSPGGGLLCLCFASPLIKKEHFLGMVLKNFWPKGMYYTQTSYDDRIMPAMVITPSWLLGFIEGEGTFGRY